MSVVEHSLHREKVLGMKARMKRSTEKKGMQMMIKLTDSKFTHQGESYNRVWKEDHT